GSTPPPSPPPRRSSDLHPDPGSGGQPAYPPVAPHLDSRAPRLGHGDRSGLDYRPPATAFDWTRGCADNAGTSERGPVAPLLPRRSEEHTSELQSRCHLG